LPAAPLRQPINKWIVDYGETACTALRDFGSEEALTKLAFRPSMLLHAIRSVCANRIQWKLHGELLN
jgi:hypothetical protein